MAAAAPTRNSGPGRWLSGHFSICLAVYDTRRGQAERQEADKILGFYPPTAPPAMQSSLVGLAHAVTMFAGTFNKDCPSHVMETDNNLWAMVNVEPGVWMLMIASRAWCGATATPKALEAYLRVIHPVFTLLNGSLSHMLESDPGASSVRRRMQPLLQEIASRLLRPEAPDHASLSCPLAPRGGAPLLRAPRATAAALQALVDGLLVFGSPGGGRVVHGAAACYGQHLIWSALGPGDTNVLYSFASRGILQAVRAGARHRTVRRPAGGPPPGAGAPPPPLAGSSQQGGIAGPGGARAARSAGGPAGISPHHLINSAYWELLPSGIVRPAGEGGEDGAGLPLLWLQGGQERCRLLCYRSGALVLFVLLHDAPPAALAAAAAALAAQLAGQALGLAARLAAELPAKHLWHVPGLRYHYSDGQAGLERSSPLSKISTLSLQSLSAAADAQAAADSEVASLSDPTADQHDQWDASCGGNGGGDVGGTSAQQRHHHHHHHHHHYGGGPRRSSGTGGAAAGRRRADPQRWAAFMSGGGAGGDAEIVLRCAHDCSVVARRSSGGGAAAGERALVAVAEGDKDRAGLPSVMGQVDALCDLACPGAFDGVA